MAPDFEMAEVDNRLVDLAQALPGSHLGCRWVLVHLVVGSQLVACHMSPVLVVEVDVHSRIVVVADEP